MKNSFLLLIASILFYSCSSNNVDLAIDNPSDRSIIVMVDTLMVEVPPKEVVWVEMGKGEHKITLEDDSETVFNFTDKAYMLNPTKSEYLKFEEFYGNSIMQSTYVSQIASKEIMFYGIPMEGKYEVIKDLINPITWDYGARESLPEMVETDGDYEVLTKILDYNEFIQLVSKSQQNGE